VTAATKSARDVVVEQYCQILMLPIILKEHSLFPHLEQYVALFAANGWEEAPLYAALAEYETRALSRTAFRGLALTIGLSVVAIALAACADMKYTTLGIGLGLLFVAGAVAGAELYLTGHGERSLLSSDRRER